MYAIPRIHRTLKARSRKRTRHIERIGHDSNAFQHLATRICIRINPRRRNILVLEARATRGLVMGFIVCR
ncbi:MAG TPA: hypothetical protein DDX19_24785 [Rhodopirellula baltica]|uniref:Uncharacterized protein n=1 Tax=Rhodopirellula bahusiensis TaxID=2014065 RepID=A0A2G1W1F6_9BACT|nr:hypothetical protein [Rhodopirellula sp.]PHQ32529.1 hypothetical protein CEE69_24915 [Rhodopirellula bahusiensis]HBE65906.1 hypothetical protein [Rhodopirellula baltica]